MVFPFPKIALFSAYAPWMSKSAFRFYAPVTQRRDVRKMTSTRRSSSCP
jgi:hypothetical protein